MIINDLDGYYIVFDTKNWNTELDTLAIKLVFVSSLRLDVLSGSLSLLCAIKFVFASLLRQDVTDRLALDAKVSRALSIKRWRTLSTSTLSSCYRCTRHRISPVNACVYLAAKILISDEDPKPFLHISPKFPSFAIPVFPTPE